MCNKLHKFKIASVKYEPFVLALANFITNIMFYNELDTMFMNIFFGCSILLIFKIFIDSIIFKFCIWHKILLLYTVVINIINWFDYSYPCIFSSNEILIIVYSVSFIFLIITIILRLKYGCRKVEND